MAEKQLYVSPKKRKICNITAAVIILTAVIFSLLCYFSVIPLDFSGIITGTILAALGLIFFCNALLQGNSVSMWLAFCFLIPSAVSFLCRSGYASYRQLYPVYIALPGLACLGAMIISREFARLLKASLIFIIAGALFLPEVFGILSIGWTLAVLFLYIAALIMAFVIYLNKGEKK